jgi:dienelactone hydrolase
MDDRYEVRDAQYLISVLADEGVAQPQKIGTTGYSYGGGISMALAARSGIPCNESIWGVRWRC